LTPPLRVLPLAASTQETAMNIRIITSIAVAAGLALSLSACAKKPNVATTPVVRCADASGNDAPCPPPRQDNGPTPQQP
jgi:hypothetical protein